MHTISTRTRLFCAAASSCCPSNSHHRLSYRRTMSDLQWEPQHHRHDRSDSITASTRSEMATRNRRFSWWQIIMDQRARDRTSSEDTAAAARPSLDASCSSDATHQTRPETSATRTDTSNLVNPQQRPWASPSAARSPVHLLPLQQTRARKPDIRHNALARKSASSGMLYQTYHAEYLLVDRRDRLRSEVRALRHKTSLLDETLRQTVHQRLVLHEERDAMSLASCSSIVPALDSEVPTIMDRGRTVPRWDCSVSDSVLWQASTPSAPGIAIKTNGQPKPTKPVLSIDVQAAQAILGVQSEPYHAREDADPALRRSTSLPALTDLPSRAKTSTTTTTTTTTTWYDHRALRKTQHLYHKLTEGNTRGSASDRITGLWKNVRMRTR